MSSTNELHQCLISLYIFTSTLVLSSDETLLRNSCQGLTGKQWLKLLPDYPAVEVECSNDYIILDHSLDNEISSYFSSFVFWHYETAGPINGDIVNWEDWFLPHSLQKKDNLNYNYLLSPDCNACDIDNNDTPQLYNTKTTYWMTGNIFLCWWMSLGSDDLLCDLDYNTYQCYSCNTQPNYDKNGNIYYDNELTPKRIYDDISSKSFTSDIDKETAIEQYYLGTGQCTTSVRKSDATIPETHDDCSSTSAGYFKPSIGTKGRFCVCTQPDTSKVSYYTASESDLARISASETSISSLSISSNSESTLTSSNNIIHLYQKDFKSGTYRITSPGTYIIMEDIQFDFNGPDPSKLSAVLATNPQTNEYWYPYSSQNTADEYPGASSSRDAYHLGFFAGITIESDDVILDLNNHELRQSDIFYFQQRWFSIIECSSSMFMPGTGPGFFGDSPLFATNTIIKNGIIGLSSHFGIHGNDNKNLRLENLIIRDFETHGVQFNGFDGIEMINIEVGPTVSQNYLRGEYGHARIVLQRLREISNKYPDNEIQFYGRDEISTAESIADELEYQMNLAFWYVNYKYLETPEIVELFNKGILNENELFDENDQSWIDAKSYFINHSGLPLGGVLHGIYLNVASNTVSFLTVYKLYTPYHSTGATLENVKIHGLRHEMNEWVRMSPVSNPAEVFMNPFGGPIDATASVGGVLSDGYNNGIVENLIYNGARLDSNNNVKYYGNIMTDAYFALNKLSNDDWGVIGVSLIGNNRLVSWAEDKTNLEDILFGCNSDPMKHAGKGIMGLRMQGVADITIKNLEIYDLIDSTALGRLDCGKYNGWSNQNGGGNFRQIEPMQIGFSGNMIQAINLNTVSNVEFKGNINIYNLNSYYGDTLGIAIWPANDNVKFINDNENEKELKIELKQFVAGSKMTVDYNKYNAKTRPNVAPQTCGVLVYETYESKGKNYITTINLGDLVESQIETKCMTGHLSCQMKPFVHDQDAIYTMIGEYNDDISECSQDWIEYFEMQKNDRRDMINNNNNNMNKERIEDATTIKTKQISKIAGLTGFWGLIVFGVIAIGMSIWVGMDCWMKYMVKKYVEQRLEHTQIESTFEYQSIDDSNPVCAGGYGTA